jgi:NAD-dependent DNA ligase
VSFEDINNAIRAKGGSWVNLKKKGDKIAGKIVAAPEVRDQVFNGKVVKVSSGPNEGKPRQEWVFTLETSDGNTVKVAAKESAQFAITGALMGRKLALNGHLQLEIMEEAVRGEKSAEYKAVYTDPTVDFPGTDDTPAAQVADDDEPPF